MRIRRPGKTALSALVPAGVALAAGGVYGIGLLAGWFDAGSVEGSTEGFVATQITPPTPRADAWAEYGRDSQRTRANTALTALTPPFRRDWTFEAGSLVEFPPAVGDGVVVFGTNAGRAYGLDLATGRRRWTHHLRGRVASSPALAGLPGTPTLPGRLAAMALFTTMRGDVVALDPHTGRERWRMSLHSPVETSPLVIGGVAYVGTGDNRVIRIRLDGSGADWVVRTDGAVKGSLARSGDTVVVGDYAGKVVALDQRTGRVRWTRTSPGARLQGSGRFYAGPAVAYGRVFIGNVNGRVLGLSATTGAVAWVRILGDYVYSSAAVADRTAYVGSYDRHLYALDAVTGRVRWTADVGERISGSPSVIGRLVWISTLAKRPEDGRTLAFDAATGARVFTFPEGRYSPAVAVDGHLVLTGVTRVHGLSPR